MSTLTYHRKPTGTTYVYRQESYWDKSKGRSATKQVCIGKLSLEGALVYNKRFSDPLARAALEKGETISESVITGQSLVLAKAAKDSGLERVLRKSLGATLSDQLLSLAYAIVATADGAMSGACIWIEDNDCPSHKAPLSSPDISRVLSFVTQDKVESFLASWVGYRAQNKGDQYCFDVTSVSSYNKNNPFVEWGYNRDREKLAQVNLALLTSVKEHTPTYFEILPGSLSDVKTIKGFADKMKKYATGKMRMLLDRGFYSEANLQCLMDGHIGFYIPVPAHIKWAQLLIDKHRDEVEAPEHIVAITEDNKEAIYGMTVLSSLNGRRVWKHLYYDTARRATHILSFKLIFPGCKVGIK